MNTEHRPLRVMFVNTFLEVGGAETLLANLIRRLDRRRFAPEVCCLKQLGSLGEQLALEVPAFHGLFQSKFDVRVLRRLSELMRQRQLDAVVTVGTGGDKMFWGRLAAWKAGVPVVISALHSTGLPDRVEWSNRRLARWTDAFIAVANAHGKYIEQHEGCPADKVRVIPNGVDTQRFRPIAPDLSLRDTMGIAREAPVAGIVAALRPEKNHELFLRAAARVHADIPDARFILIGDGPRRADLQALAAELGLNEVVHFLGTRRDVAELLSVIDVVALTSRMEANPVSLLEAMAAARPVIATRVGSIPETVAHGRTGYLVDPGDDVALADYLAKLMREPETRHALGAAARERVVREFSIERMVEGYEDLIEEIYYRKRGVPGPEATSRSQHDAEEPTELVSSADA